MSPDGLPIATYDFGDPDAPVVVAVHGFASGALLNWHASGWTRDLLRAGTASSRSTSAGTAPPRSRTTRPRTRWSSSSRTSSV